MLKGAIIQIVVAVILLSSIIGTQAYYDEQKMQYSEISFPLSPLFVKSFDFGLHSAVASLTWIDTIIQLPFLQKGKEAFDRNFNLINELDPRFSFPYAFTVLVLPGVEAYPDRINAAIEIGERGVREADPDWRVSFYLATLYYLEKDDIERAAHFYDITARNPNAQPAIKRFSTSYALAHSLRERTKMYWQAVYDSAQDEISKEYAKSFLDRLELFDIIESAAKVYYSQFGVNPRSMQDLVDAGIFSEIPVDPYGFELYFTEHGNLNVRDKESDGQFKSI